MRAGRFCVLCAALLVVGCSPGYVLRSAWEEAKILSRREPIADVLADENLDIAFRAKLEAVLAARSFARDTLGLDVGGSYETLAAVDGSQAVHVVTAAYPLELRMYTWWFPLIGRVPYKGYFSKERARREAQSLREQGLDVYPRTSVAFSTLGWFDDPLLSNLLHMTEDELVNVVLHELLHQTIYLPGSAVFNESFANFVGARAAIEFFSSRGESAKAERQRAAWVDAVQFSAFLGESLDQLEAAYEAGATMEARTSLFAAIQRRYADHVWQTSRYDSFATRELNNAVLLHMRVYLEQLGLFETCWQRFDHDLPEVITQVVAAAETQRAAPFEAVAATCGEVNP